MCVWGGGQFTVGVGGGRTWLQLPRWQDVPVCKTSSYLARPEAPVCVLGAVPVAAEQLPSLDKETLARAFPAMRGQKL